MKNSLIDKYCIEHSENESTLQKKIREYTFKHEKYPQMISGWEFSMLTYSFY